MGWLFGRKRHPQDANEMLRRYNEAEAARLAAMTAEGASTTHRPSSVPLSAGSNPGEFVVEDVFTITGRGQVVTGTVRSGVLRVDDSIVIVREGASIATTRITGVEMFRRTAREARAGDMAGLLLGDRLDVSRGDVIRPATSG